MLEWYELLPVIWLGFVCFLDIWLGFGLRLFYCRTLKDVVLEHDETATDHIQSSCAICQGLIPYKRNFRKSCPGMIGSSSDDLWKKLKQMCYRYQQLAFFEVISIQFFIGFIKSQYKPLVPYIIPSDLPLHLSQIIPVSQIDISNFYLLVAIFFMIIFYFVITIIKHDPCILYVNKYIRLFFITCIFFFSLRF